MKLWKVVMGTAALALLPMSVQAALVSATPPVCSLSDVVGNPGTDNIAPLYCSGAWDGNDSNQQADILAKLAEMTLPTVSTWAYGGTSDPDDDPGFGPFTGNPEATSGTVGFDDPQTGLFALSIKASNSFSLYIFDGGVSGISTIRFVTDGTATNKKGKAQDSSHFGLWIGDDGRDSDEVPEPTTLALVGGTLLMGFSLARKRRAAR